MTLFEASICVLVFPTYRLHLLVLRLHLYAPYIHRFYFFRFTALHPWRPLNIQDCPVAMVSSSRAVATLRVPPRMPVSFVSGMIMFHAFLASHTHMNIFVIFIANVYSLFFLSCVSSLSFRSRRSRSLHMYFMKISTFARLTWSKSYIFRFQNRALFFKWVNERKIWDERELNKEML